MKKTEKRRRPEGGGWDDAPRRSGTKERFVEKRQKWQQYLDGGSDEEVLRDIEVDDGADEEDDEGR